MPNRSKSSCVISASGLVSGHDFSHAEQVHGREWALAPVMARPARNANPQQITRSDRTFFATTRTSMGRRLFQSDRNANLLIDLLRSYVAAGKFKIHDFVVMPDHLHLLITVPEDMSIEKAMQLVKGGFSYRLKKESGYLGEVWQRGFSEVSVYEEASYDRFRMYIAQNPVKAGLARVPEEYPHCFACLANRKRARADAPE
jgi:putative transposase